MSLEYNYIFRLPEDDLPFTDVKTFPIPLRPGPMPVNKRQYRISQAHWAEFKREINKLLEDDVIEPNDNPYNSPSILLLNLTFRPCVDFRNVHTKVGTYVVPIAAN